MHTWFKILVADASIGVAVAALATSLVAGDAQRTPPPPTLRARYGLAPAASIDPPRTALVLVDWQRELFDGGLPLPDARAALARAVDLRSWARRTGVTVVHVDNVGRPGARLFAPGSPAVAIVDELAPADGELHITKSQGGAFSKTDLDAVLRRRGIEVLVVAGLMTHLAVDASARDAVVLGYRVIVASDATATRDLPAVDGSGIVDHAVLQRAELASLADRWADVMTTRAIVTLPRTR